MAKKQKKEVEISFESIYVMLNKSYIERREPISDDYEGNTTIDTKDMIEVENCDEKGFVLKFTRTVELNPKAVFFVQVDYLCHFEFDEDTEKFFNKNIENIKFFAEERKREAIDITNVINRASMMISFLTYQINSNPVITQPVYIEE